MAEKPATAELVKPRRRFQYSLRLLFLLMTLASVMAGWLSAVRYAARLESQCRAFGHPPVDPYADERYRRSVYPERYKNAPPLPKTIGEY